MINLGLLRPILLMFDERKARDHVNAWQQALAEKIHRCQARAT